MEALDVRGNNFLAAVCQGEASYGLAVSDITTGEFRCTEIADEQAFLDELGRVQPSEILLATRDGRLRERIYKEYPAIHLTSLPDESFRAMRPPAGAERMKRISLLKALARRRRSSIISLPTFPSR